MSSNGSEHLWRRDDVQRRFDSKPLILVKDVWVLDSDMTLKGTFASVTLLAVFIRAAEEACNLVGGPARTKIFGFCVGRS